MRVLVGMALLSACGRIGFDGEDGAWYAGEFGACSDSCTTGAQTRVVECRTSDGRMLGETACVEDKPATTRDCSETGCGWTTSDWETCSVNCGGGTQPRAVECKTDSGISAPDAYCSGTKPIAVQACNPQACCNDLTYPDHELPGDGVKSTCTSMAPWRYMVFADIPSVTERCLELGYDAYGDYHTVFIQADWCSYCNAATKIWDGTQWVHNGCMGGVQFLRCCNNP